MKNFFGIIFFTFIINSGLANELINSPNKKSDPEKPPVKKNIINKKVNCFTLCNPYKLNMMCRMVQTGNYQGVLSLINKGVDINEKSVRLTPLMYAARHNRVEIVRLLIVNGADLHLTSEQGYTALKWAELSNATEVYDELQIAINAQSGIR